MMFVEMIRAAAGEFDDHKYPREVYFHLLQCVRLASTSLEMGEALSRLLAWKDGKVRRDPAGECAASPSGIRYRLSATRPNTYGIRHREILYSQPFFEWACNIRTLDNFDATYVYDLQRRFNLWTSGNIVIPVFVLHCLRPRIFPIVDVWVLLAQRLLDVDTAVPPRAPPRPTLGDYERFHAWWLRILAEANLAPMTAQLNQLKEIDDGLWAWGKRASQVLAQDKSGGRPEDEEGKIKHAPNEKPGTESRQFKMLAISKQKNGATQRQAILDAALEMGIELKSSYSNYPGSHFDRWRKQGLC